MKKILTIVMALLILCSLTGCIVYKDSDDTKQISNDNKESAKSNETNQLNTPKNDISITEQVCLEHDGIKITANSIIDDSFWGEGVKLLVENNSNKDYSIRTNAVIVNNCMVSSYFSCEVAAGKKSNDTLYLSSSSLEAAGITNIGQIEVYFKIQDTSSNKIVYETECVTIKTSLYDKMDTTANDEGHELYNKDGIRIVGKYVDENTFWGSSVLLYIENKTDKNIYVSCDDMSINGFMVSSFLYSTIYKGKYIIDNITVSADSLEENNITSIDDIELKFEIKNSSTHKLIAETGVLKFSAK